MLVRRDVQDVAALEEGVLGAVAVMDVVVEDGDALGAPLSEQPGGGDGDVVEQAEAHRLGGRGVVAGRAHQTECVTRPAGADGVGCLDKGAHGAQCGVERAGRHRGVGVDPPTLAGTELADERHVGGCMHELERGVVRGLGLEVRHALPEAAGLQRLDDGREPLRALGMLWAGAVREKARRVREHGRPVCAHGRARTRSA